LRAAELGQSGRWAEERGPLVGASECSDRVRKWCSVSILAVLLAAAGVPIAASAASGAGGGEGRVSAAEESTVAATWQAEEHFRELWNANNMDQLVAEIYTDESVMAPPNHDPIRGRAAILEFLKPARAELGEFSKEDVSCQPTSSDTLVSMFCDYKFRSGSLRLNAHEAWHRQPDGSVRNMVDMFGFR
jgi:ketosteroid isomerase-like protein